MRRIIIILLSLTSLLPLACGKKEKAAPAGAVVQTPAAVYYCPMHPTITSDRPGNCPICGMSLVKRAPSAAPAATATPGLAAIALSPEQRVTGNVKTQRAELSTHTGEIVTTGRVAFDERRTAQITSYSSGRIERLFVNFTGDSVRRGQTVAAIYSPDLFATQQEYLLALENLERMRRAGFAAARSASEDLVESTRRRLMLFGMTAAQIATLEKTRKTIFATNITAPVSGVVTKKLVVEQQYVAQGQPLLEVADLSQVWIEADVYEQQLPNVTAGNRVQVTAAAVPGRTYEGRIAFIGPVLAGPARTAQVRIDMPNPGLALKPDMYVSVRIAGPPAPPHIMLPASAVIDRGQSQFVWIEVKPGTYEPRAVKTGGHHGAAIVILSGVSPGDEVVVEGAFLLDSEAQLRGTPATASHEH